MGPCSPSGIMSWYHALSPDDITLDESREELDVMVDNLGFDAVNLHVLEDGFNLFLLLLKNCRVVPVESILDLAVERRTTVSIISQPKQGGKREDALEISINVRCPELVQLLIKYIAKGACDPREVSKVFSGGLCYLLEKQEDDPWPRYGHMSTSFRTIFTDAITDQSFLVPLGDLYLPECLFMDSRDPFIVGLHNQCVPEDMNGLFLMWKEMHPQLASISTADYNRAIKVKARSYLVPFDNFATPGKHGILEPLLLLDCSHRVFKSLPIIALVKWKWEKYAFSMANIQMIKCISLLVTYTIYSILFMRCTKQGDNSQCHPVLEILSITSAAFALLMLWEEFVQLATYIRDGRKYRHKQFSIVSPSSGLHYWLFVKWNTMEIASFVLVGIVLPILHFFPSYNFMEWHSWLVGITGIMVWCTLLYYLQLFEKTSPLVAMIFDITVDMAAFLSIAIFLLVGFALGFCVLFHKEEGLIHEEFSSIFRACTTLFGYILGSIHIDALAVTKYPNVAFAAFAIYELAMAIILLSLLVAIMADSYDRIKERQNSTFVMSKAAIIEDMECLYGQKLKKVDTPRYMHILVPSHNRSIGHGDSWFETQDGEIWQGRILHLEKKIRGMMITSSEKVSEVLSTASKELRSGIDSLVSGIYACCREKSACLTSGMSNNNPNSSIVEYWKDLQLCTKTNLDDIQNICEEKLEHIQNAFDSGSGDRRYSRTGALVRGRRACRDAIVADMDKDGTTLESCIDRAVGESFAIFDSRVKGLESSVGEKLSEMSAFVDFQLCNLQQTTNKIAHMLRTEGENHI